MGLAGRTEWNNIQRLPATKIIDNKAAGNNWIPLFYGLSQLLLRIRNASQSRSRKIFKRKNISIFLVFLLSSLIEKLSFWWKIFFNRWAVGDTLLLVICLDNSWARLKSQLNSKFCSFAWFLKDCKFSICKVLQMQVMFCEASILSTFCPSNL